MQAVGRLLVKTAMTTSDETDRDLFARSAFNRYYYACFLLARQLCRSFTPDVDSIAHGNMPTYLRTTIKRTIQQRVKLLSSGGKSRALSDVRRHGSQCMEYIKDLAIVLEEAYRVRVIADYRPEQAVVFGQGNTMILAETEVNDAGRWVSRVEHHVKAIEDVWRQIRP